MSIRVRETAQSPWTAKEVKLLCPLCSNAVYVPIPWNVTAEQRQQEISKAISEHRVLCSAAPTEAARVYSISYPRA